MAEDTRDPFESSSEFLTAMYHNRQVILFVDDNAFDEIKAKIEERRKADRQLGVAWTVWEYARWITVIPYVQYAQKVLSETAKKMVSIWQKATDAGVLAIPVPLRWAPSFDLPPGHPINEEFYAGHPFIAKKYFPLVDFPRVLFEEKFAEAVTLLIQLGARKISVHHSERLEKFFSGRAASGEQKIEVESEEKTKFSVIFQTEFPKESTSQGLDFSMLKWYTHEPTWQLVVRCRQEFKAAKVKLYVHHQSNWGIGLDLVTKLKNAGIEVGGESKEYSSGAWLLEAEF